MYEKNQFSTKSKLFYVKTRLFLSKLRNFAMLLHPCTETNVKSSKFVFLDPNNL